MGWARKIDMPNWDCMTAILGNKRSPTRRCSHRERDTCRLAGPFEAPFVLAMVFLAFNTVWPRRRSSKQVIETVRIWLFAAQNKQLALCTEEGRKPKLQKFLEFSVYVDKAEVL